jgi:hypothetical protein
MGKLAIFIGGLVLGAVGAFVGLLYLEMRKPPPDDQIVFAPKNFYDSKMDGEFGDVGISGTLTALTGKRLDNNTYAARSGLAFARASYMTQRFLLWVISK